MRIVVWLVRAALFFVLFAFALNNTHPAEINWFFGYRWQTTMVFVVLGAFTLGCVFGVLAMLPSWWRHRRVARRHAPPGERDTVIDDAQPVVPSVPEHPPRDGL